MELRGLGAGGHHSVRPDHDGSASSAGVTAKENWMTSVSSGRRHEVVAARSASQPVRPSRVAQSQWRVQRVKELPGMDTVHSRQGLE